MGLVLKIPIILALVSLSLVVYGAYETVLAKSSAYESGYAHGVSDAKKGCSDRCDWYILQPGKGFAFHTEEFVRGYIAGFCATDPHTGSDADEASWSCPPQ